MTFPQRLSNYASPASNLPGGRYRKFKSNLESLNLKADNYRFALDRSFRKATDVNDVYTYTPSYLKSSIKTTHSKTPRETSTRTYQTPKSTTTSRNDKRDPINKFEQRWGKLSVPEYTSYNTTTVSFTKSPREIENIPKSNQIYSADYDKFTLTPNRQPTESRVNFRESITSRSIRSNNDEPPIKSHQTITQNHHDFNPSSSFSVGARPSSLDISIIDKQEPELSNPYESILPSSIKNIDDSIEVNFSSAKHSSAYLNAMRSIDSRVHQFHSSHPIENNNFTKQKHLEINSRSNIPIPEPDNSFLSNKSEDHIETPFEIKPIPELPEDKNRTQELEEIQKLFMLTNQKLNDLQKTLKGSDLSDELATESTNINFSKLLSMDSSNIEHVIDNRQE